MAVQPIGSEFLVNTTTDGQQHNQAVAALTDGRFVVAWTDFSSSADDPNGAVRAQLFAADGTTLGLEFLVNTTTTGIQAGPFVTGLSDGRFVVAWTQVNAGSIDVYAQVFASDGSKSGSEFLVSSTVFGHQLDPTVTALAAGRFVVAWTDGSQTGDDISGYAVHAQIFDADGNAVGSELLVNAATAGNQQYPAITALSGGGFVVAWTDSFRAFALAQIYDANGNRIGSEILVSETASAQDSPAVVGLADGRFVVLWDELGVSTSSKYGQVFSADGSPSGASFLVSSWVGSDAGTPRPDVVGMLPDGRFIVAWTDLSQTGGDADSAIHAQIFNADGTKSGDEFLANTTTTGGQAWPSLSILADGNLVIAWSDFSQTAGDTSDSAVRAQIFEVFPDTNHAPVASNISVDAYEDTNDPIVKLIAVFTDADLSDTFTFTFDPTVTKGTVANNNDGTFTYDPNGQFEYLRAGETATDTFAYTVTDSHGASSTATATITIHGENEPVDLTGGNLIREMAQLALEAYVDTTANAKQRNWHAVTAQELDLFENFADGLYSAPMRRGEAEALVLQGEIDGVNTLTIAFRGTDDWGDIRVWPSAGAYFAQFAPLIESLPDFIAAHGIEQVIVTGHSLGGAMVQDFLAATTHDIDPNIVFGYTWGSPGADLSPTNPHLVNFLHTKDPVPLLGNARYERSGTDISINSAILNDSAPHPGSAVDPAAHNMGNYVADIILLIARANDEGSQFYSTAEAAALRSGSLWSSDLNDFQVVPGTSVGDRVLISSRDQFVLVGDGNDIFDWVDLGKSFPWVNRKRSAEALQIVCAQSWERR